MSVLSGPPNPYETAARLKKVYALANKLWALGATPEAARTLTDSQWTSLAKVAGVNPPSEETRSLVIAELGVRQATSAARSEVA